MKQPGQTVLTNVSDAAEGELLLTDQPGGETVEICAVAVNPADESVPGATISVAVG